MLFWVESRACKAPQTRVASIWGPLGAFYNEICVTNVLQHSVTAILLLPYSTSFDMNLRLWP